MKTYGRASLWAATLGGGVLAAGLSLRTWDMPPPPGAKCGTGEPVYLWQGLAHLPKEDLSRFWTRHDADVVENAVIFAFAATVALVAYRARRPRNRPIEAGDYEDGRGGSTLDGRGT
jgi:hypothetical protein